ncbi:MAG: tetratricopeptide repeat protein [Phycisphaerales bacterium]|nr:tetratricopeptide repeat protein [Phycisphaerales bacterium]
MRNGWSAKWSLSSVVSLSLSGAALVLLPLESPVIARAATREGAEPAVARSAPGVAADAQAIQDGSAVQRALVTALDHRRAGRLDEAATVLDKALAEFPGNEALEYELLAVKEATGDLSEAQGVALEAMRAERQAATELAVGAVRLNLLRARARFAAGKLEDAERATRAALDRLGDLPADVDREPLRAPLDELLSRIAESRRSNPRIGSSPRATPTLSDFGFLPQEEHGTSTSGNTPPSTQTSPDQPAAPQDAAASSVEHANPMTGPPPSPIGAGGISRPEKIDANFQAYHDAQLQRWGEDPQIYQRVIAYPPDWPMICRMRQQYASGLLYRGPEFVGDDGQTKYTAVYDIADLTADIPHFNSAPLLDLTAMMQAHADRVALRQYSDIFTGTAADLAAGIPLLGCFGGVDEYHVPPISPGTQYQYQDVLRMVDDVLSEK